MTYYHKKPNMRDRNAMSQAKIMPPLFHSSKSGSFDITQSEVADWISRIPQVRQTLFDKAREFGYIEFDQQSQAWRGIDYVREFPR